MNFSRSDTHMVSVARSGGLTAVRMAYSKKAAREKEYRKSRSRYSSHPIVVAEKTDATCGDGRCDVCAQVAEILVSRGEIAVPPQFPEIAEGKRIAHRPLHHVGVLYANGDWEWR